jgi:nitrogen fixation negative regulator NifL
MKKILVVEDDQPFRTAVTTALRRRGYAVCEAPNGTAGLARAFAEQPSLILSDVNMAQGTGLELLKELRVHPKTSAIPVIIMTGEAHKTDARFSMNQGADDFLAKPFSMPQMLDVISARLQRQEGIERAEAVQHQAERLSAEEKIKLQTTALEAAANAIAITHRNGRILWVNPAFTRLTGYAADEAVGQTHRLLKSDQHPDEFYANLWTTINTGNVWQGELINRRKDGSLYHEEMTITPVCDSGGEIQNFIAIKLDVSDRKTFEAQMDVLRTEHSVILNAIGEGVHWVDKNGRIKFENPASAKMLGYEVDELIGKPAHVTMHHKRPDGSTYPQTDCPIYATLRDGVIRHVTDEVFWRRDGTSFPVDYSCTPVYEKDGTFGGSVVIFSDITQRKRMESQLLQFQKLESIGQLAAGIAHEINTPTQYVGDNTRFVKDSFSAISKVLQSHAELLAAAKAGSVTPDLVARNDALIADSDLEYLCEQIPTALKETLEGVERVSKIVRAMKEFSHPGGREKNPADLNKAIESTVTVAGNEWKYVAEVKLDLEPELPLVPCFIGEFNQCILNLVVNAAHAIGDVVKKNPGSKGLITVQTRRLGDQVEVRVTDTGTGIPESARSKIFEPFFTTKDVGKGTGQGLSIIYGSIVRRHGGTVTFETEVGRGTAFIIRLPLKTKAAAEEQFPPRGVSP